MNQLTAEAAPGEAVSEPKNIRRRVYDAINVLMAMEIIAKDQKLLKWKGLPTNSAQEYKQYEEMRRNKEEQIAKARAHLRDLLLQVRRPKGEGGRDCGNRLGWSLALVSAQSCQNGTAHSWTWISFLSKLLSRT